MLFVGFSNFVETIKSKIDILALSQKYGSSMNPDRIAVLFIKTKDGSSYLKTTFGPHGNPDKQNHISAVADHAKVALDEMRQGEVKTFKEQLQGEKHPTEFSAYALRTNVDECKIALGGFSYEICEAILLAVVWEKGLFENKAAETQEEKLISFLQYYKVTDQAILNMLPIKNWPGVLAGQPGGD